MGVLVNMFFITCAVYGLYKLTKVFLKTRSFKRTFEDIANEVQEDLKD